MLAMKRAVGNNHVAIGYRALSGNISTSYTQNSNTAVGASSAKNLTTAQSVTVMGKDAGEAITTGNFNTFIGASCGTTTTTGTNNSLLGYFANASSSTVSNQITLGNSSIATLRCQVTSITSLSDARDKIDVAPLQAGLDFVERLDPVSFTWNMRDGGKVGIPDTGFIAQDLQQTQEDTGVTIPGLVFDDNPEKLEAAYGKLVPVLVKAIQELSAKVTELEAQLNTGD